MPRAIQRPARVPGIAAARKGRALQPVVAEFAVGHRGNVDQHQPFDRVGDDGVVVDRPHRLFLIELQ